MESHQVKYDPFTGRSSPVPPATPSVNIQQPNSTGAWEWSKPAPEGKLFF